MSDDKKKKKKKKEEQAPQEQQTNGEEPNGQAPEQEESPCAELEAQLEDLQHRYTRLAADFDNYRKRLERQHSDMVSRASEQLISRLVPILDSFEHALASAAGDKGLTRGIEMIRDQLLNLLQQEGLETIEAEGQPFDPQYHEACGFCCRDSEPDNVVVEEIRRGYKLGGKLIRPSMVQVNRLKEEEDNNG